jgi:nucleotide-binding universal stress UspA family protein
MSEEQRILLATDFSKPAERAYAYAAKLAKVLQAKVVILNVLEGPLGLDREFPVNTVFLKQLQEESDRDMAKLVRVVETDGLACESRQVYGGPAACISKVAGEMATTLIVMGTHGHTGWSRLLLGSNAEAVVREAPCPVLTIRATEADVAAERFSSPAIRRLLVPIDFSECAQEALEYAATLAKQLGARLALVHAMEAAAYPLDFALFGVSEEAALRGQIQLSLRGLVSALKAEGIDAESLCAVGTPAEIILKEAKDGSADAIVMGTHGRRGLNRLALGSVAEYVVRHAACPVFTVKSPRYRHGGKSEIGGARQNA